MKIESVGIGRVSIPLKRPFKTALRQVNSAEDIIVKVVADTGETGFGNAPPTLVITGESQDSIVAAIRDTLGPSLIGLDVENLEGIMARLDAGMVHNTSARAALDIAVHDLFGQRFGIPLATLFGGLRTRIESDLTISLNDVPTMVADARDAVATGYTALKLKVGNDPELDRARVRAIREGVGPAIRLRIDANQGWSPKEAVRLIQRMAADGLDIELIEQPVKAHDVDGLKYVTDRVDIPIMADEAAFGPADVFRLLSMRACDLINIKLMKAGGLHPAQRIAHLAESAGVQCMMGCMLESPVGITAAACLAAGKAVISRADLDGIALLAENPVAGGVRVDGCALVLPPGPGLGISEVAGWVPIAVVR